MTRLALLTVILLLSTTSTKASAPAHLWSKGFDTNIGSNATCCAVDASGNVLVAGYFYGTVNLGGVDLVSAGSADIFLAKYDANGVHRWSKRLGSTNFDAAQSIAVDASGNVFVTGDFQGTVDFGGGGLVSAGNDDVFLAKYGANGFHAWSQRFGSTGADGGYSLAVDGSGNVIMTDVFNGTVNFGGVGLISAGGTDIFLAKYNFGGVHQWSQRFGSTSTDVGQGIAVNGFGDVLVTGYFQGTVNFGGGGLISAGATDIFLAKYNPNGVHQWSQRFGSTGGDVGLALAADASGNVFAIGEFNGTVNFGGGNLVSAGDYDIFLAKYNTNSIHQWSQRFGSTNADDGYSISLDTAGNVFATGYFQGTVDFGGGNRVSTGFYDIFLAKYNTNGVHQWSEHFGEIDFDIGRAVDVDGSGNVFVAGAYVGGVDFGGGPLTAAANGAAFLAKFSSTFPPPAIGSINDIGNDQGRKVKIRFARSGADDAAASNPVTSYEAYRRDDAPPAATWREPVGLSARELLDNGWTQAGAVSAHAMPTYGIDVPTIGDSTIVAGQYYSVFFVRAATTKPSVFFDSPIDSGYSLDNLAPGVPQNLVYTAGQLAWDESVAADFDYFTVYGSNTNNFGTATLVDYRVAPTLDATGTPFAFFFVTATDFSGNEGRPATINALTGVGGTPTRYILSVSNYPNPFNPRTTVSYTVPSRGDVTVAIYDAHGARIATLVRNESRDAGAYRLDWDGRADSGATVSSGVYFARIEHNGAARSKKMVMLK